MEQFMSVLGIILPIFTAVALGVYARRSALMTREQMDGLQQFVMKFGLPCVLFNSCFTADLGSESLTSMVLVIPLLLLSSLWGFRSRRKAFPYHNFPMLFSAQESGMLGIPLFITLFGAEQAYRLGVLDLAQSFIAIPVIAILSANAGTSPSLGQIVGKVLRSPFLIMSLLGLALNLSGAADAMEGVGLAAVLTETAGFIAQPVSASMLFSVGYNFSIRKNNCALLFRVAAIHAGMFALFCVVMQGILSLMPAVDVETRWAVLLYCALPSSYLTASLGRNEEEYTVASGVCSLLTLFCLIIFCVMAVVAV